MKRVLVVRNDKIGDLLLATPVLDALKAQGAYVGVLASPYAAPLLETDRAVDALIPDGEGVLERIKEKNFDSALVLWGNWKNAWTIWKSRIPERVGISGRPYSFLYSQRLDIRRSQALKSEAEYDLDFVGAPYSAPRLHLSAKDKAVALKWLRVKKFKRPVMLHPGSRGSAQNWEPGRYIELGKALNAPLLVTAGPGEAEMAAVVAKGCGAVAMKEPLPLRVFAALCGQASLFVSASTGPMHLAAALGAPTLSFFPGLKSMSPRRWGPRGNSHAVLTPQAGGHVTDISVTEALRAARTLLKDMHA